jgi:periplasmic divalent cation tolerance protein
MIKQEESLSVSSYVEEKQGETEQAAHENAAVLVYTTFPSPSDAKNAGRALVEVGLAACVNIIPGMTAIYQWDGKIEEGSEAVMIVKTIAARSEAVLEEIKRLHPYSLPARLVLPVAGGGADFLGWIAQQCRA